MKHLLIAIALVATVFFISCGQDGMSPTANSAMKTQTSSAASTGTTGQTSISQGQGEDHHVTADLVPVDDSGVTGHVTIEQLPHGGVNISVVAFGLTPGADYLSLYYENHTCELEPYSEDDVIGNYTADAAGEGHTQNKLEDDLDEVNSVSVRKADFTLVACADIHP